MVALLNKNMTLPKVGSIISAELPYQDRKTGLTKKYGRAEYIVAQVGVGGGNQDPTGINNYPDGYYIQIAPVNSNRECAELGPFYKRYLSGCFHDYDMLKEFVLVEDVNKNVLSSLRRIAVTTENDWKDKPVNTDNNVIISMLNVESDLKRCGKTPTEAELAQQKKMFYLSPPEAGQLALNLLSNIDEMIAAEIINEFHARKKYQTDKKSERENLLAWKEKMINKESDSNGK